MQYDRYKVSAVINEINRFDHSGSARVGTPALFGMTFRRCPRRKSCRRPTASRAAISPTARRPARSGPSALGFIDEQVAAMMHALTARDLARHTAIILSAKHGQSPQRPAALTRINGGTILAALDAAWMAAGHAGPLVSFSINDDGTHLVDGSFAGGDRVRQAIPSWLFGDGQ
jgi:hypothetical protein